ncbi:MAG: hypothetical protein ACFBSE_16075, partial [Prochloraceae cyanobacterium]
MESKFQDTENNPSKRKLQILPKFLSPLGANKLTSIEPENFFPEGIPGYIIQNKAFENPSFFRKNLNPLDDLFTNSSKVIGKKIQTKFYKSNPRSTLDRDKISERSQANETNLLLEKSDLNYTVSSQQVEDQNRPKLEDLDSKFSDRSQNTPQTSISPSKPNIIQSKSQESKSSHIDRSINSEITNLKQESSAKQNNQIKNNPSQSLPSQQNKNKSLEISPEVKLQAKLEHNNPQDKDSDRAPENPPLLSNKLTNLEVPLQAKLPSQNLVKQETTLQKQDSLSKEKITNPEIPLQRKLEKKTIKDSDRAPENLISTEEKTTNPQIPLQTKLEKKTIKDSDRAPENPPLLSNKLTNPEIPLQAKQETTLQKQDSLSKDKITNRQIPLQTKLEKKTIKYSDRAPENPP